MTKAWVIGEGGLLGSALRKALLRAGAGIFTPAQRFCWHEESELKLRISRAIAEFSKLAGNNDDTWQIYWAAGTGTMASHEDELAIESNALKFLLKELKINCANMLSRGTIFFASSAGAVYAGSHEELINEKTIVKPINAYGREKLKQEELLSDFGESNCTVFIARITTLYGVGQRNGKQQGLISLLARNYLRNIPVQIYVPFDTIRDYITADDASEEIVAHMFALQGKYGTFEKIVASEEATTIAEIISTFKKVVKRNPRIITCRSNKSRYYAKRILFRSTLKFCDKRNKKTSLLVGIAQVVEAERLQYIRNETNEKRY